jgi:hypothetical protein
MRAFLLNALLLGTALTLSGCGKESKAEEKVAKGQVIATVDGEDVTIYELNTELQGVNLPNGSARKSIEQAALQRIIDRKILANIARKQGLEKTPDYLLQSRRSDETILVSLLQRDTASKIPPVTDEDAEKFVAANPLMFGEHKLLIIDQIQFPMPADRAKLKEFEPLKTLDDIEQKLTSDGVEFRRVPTSIDTLQVPVQITKNILALPPGEVFVVPSGGALSANKIVEVRNSPITGSDAVAYAKQVIRKQRLAEKATKDFEPALKAAKDKVVYQAGYAPPKAPAKPAAPAAAPTGN